MRGISIVIPSYNGKHLLERFLPSVIKACETYEGETEMIVVDDGSVDGTKEFVMKSFPDVKVIRIRNNKGFASACNRGAYESKYNLLILLNNDVEVSRDFIEWLPHHFGNKDIFGVRMTIRKTMGGKFLTQESIRTGLEFRYGFLNVPIIELRGNENSITSTVSGGACILDKEKFLALGGFDIMFNPYYWEDVDLSIRALKRGWKIIYEPKSLAIHHGSQTIGKINKRFVRKISERNRYFLVWKNIEWRLILIHHIPFVPILMLIKLLKCDFAGICGSLMALIELPKILKIRKEEKYFWRVRDETLFKKFAFTGRRFLQILNMSMNKFLKVSVIVITKDRREPLKKCIESLNQLDYPKNNLEIVIVEASDNYKPIKISNKIKHIFIPTREAGFSNQRNIGVKNASYDNIIFIDDDVIVSDDWFKNMLNSVNESIFAMMGAVFPENPNIVGFCEGVLGHPGGGFRFHHFSQGRVIPVESVSTCNTLFKKEVIKKAGFFSLNQKYGTEDTDISLKISEKLGKGKLFYNPNAIVYHKPRNSIKKIIPWYIRRGKGDIEIFLNHKSHIKYILSSSVFIKIVPVVVLGLIFSPWIILAVGFLWYIWQIWKHRFMCRYFYLYNFPTHKKITAILGLPGVKSIADIMFDFGKILRVIRK